MTGPGSRRKAASLLAVLGLVSVMTFLAAAMTALFLANLNFTQGTFNGDIALSQAEAGLNEVLYKLANDEAYTFGQGEEEILGSVAHDLSMDRSYYRVTFKSGTGFPHSTNNVEGDRPSGYLSRAVAEGFVHVISTGFCRGQYRTVEAMVREPEAPFGLASSARIHSKFPLQITGTSSARHAQDGNFDRPGHLICNSPGGVVIDRDTSANPRTTSISGFVQSVGPISLDPGANVKAGIRPYASAGAIPKFNVAGDFDPQGLPGTIQIVEVEHDGQDLDCIYRSGHNLTFNGPVRLHDAFLFVKGNLTVRGGISGKGAIVVDGNVDVLGEVSLSGSNNVALLSSGKVTLRGSSEDFQSNFFQGYVYAEGGVDAKNLTVVGSLLVNHDPSRPEPEMLLDRVAVVNNEGQGSVTFTAQSYTYTTTQTRAGEANGLTFDWDLWRDHHGDAAATGDSGSGGIPEEEIREKLQYILTYTGPGDNQDSADKIKALGDFNTFLADPNFSPGTSPGLADVRAALALVLAAKPDADEFLSMADPGPEPPLSTPAHQQWQRYHTLKSELAQTWSSYESVASAFVEAYYKYVRTQSSGNGARRLRPGAPPPDVQRDYVLDLNKYLPLSDRLQVTYWQIYGRRL